MKMTPTIDANEGLPAGFEDLTSVAGEWALPTEQERYEKRLSTTLSVLQSFYDAIYPRMEAVLQYLSDVPADDSASLPKPTRKLYHLALSYFEASHPIELKWKGVDLDDAFPASRIIYQAPSCTQD
jgi:hypothetical protein